MVIIHRVALEMAHADRTRQAQTGTGVVQRMEIVQLDADDEMVDTFQPGLTADVTQGPPGGNIIPFQPHPLPTIEAADAPPVMWDVGVDLLEYPEYYNSQRNVSPSGEDTLF
ncbi:unnamed protein product [Eruca vesicaria subsp. sativa]|uniref:Uncharacterized protein n=1 Tax=Eruca vesicaria subsp. sativa TaxID=29727 RepID=A0ABC8LG63_ERUVS|nr:unnamed protein product [Eruca vesicaria subsp. sativa]